MTLKNTLLLLLIVTCAVLGAFNRKAAVLDLGPRLNDGLNGIISLKQAMSVAGIPYVVTEEVETACEYSVIYVNCRIEYNAFNADEMDLLADYVASGGVLVGSYLSETDLFDLFGVSASVAGNQRYRMTWNVYSGDPSLQWFDDDNEITISLGATEYPSIFFTRAYTCDDATPLAFFDDTSVGVTRNDYGAGRAYLFGPQFRDLMVRNMTDHSFDAMRHYSNIFEPTSDTVYLWFREIYREAVPCAAILNTAPANFRNTLIITHDIDCFPAMRLMMQFADWETDMGLRAQYFITTHYMTDWCDGNYYDPYIPELQALCSTPHEIGSHSVGHFPDFMHEDIFPRGTPGVQRADYNPHYNGTVTTGGTVYGECELSKQLLNTDCGANVTSFRAGYLFFNDYQFDILDSIGCDVESSFSANELLSQFPLGVCSNRAFNGPLTGLTEVGLAISDDTGMNAMNYESWVSGQWYPVFEKCYNNGAPVVLLIHPTEMYKLDAEQMLYQMMPIDTNIMTLNDYAHFWRDRQNLDFDTTLEGATLSITVPDDFDSNELSWYVPDLPEAVQVVVRTVSGRRLSYEVDLWSQGSVVHRRSAYLTDNNWAPEFELDESELDFGTLLAGDSLITAVTYSNIGNYPLEITEAFVDGEGFHLLNSARKFLRPYETDTLYVRFAPVGSLDYQGYLNLSFSDPTIPRDHVVLNGAGLVPSTPPASLLCTRADSTLTLRWDPSGVELNGLWRAADAYRVYGSDDLETFLLLGETGETYFVIPPEVRELPQKFFRVTALYR
jgi:hypothetical protein